MGGKGNAVIKGKRRDAVLLRELALSYPEAHEEFPWGERVVKVRNKVFVFLGQDGPELALSIKLPESGLLALNLPFVSPSGYGLGKSGWVTARFAPDENAPLEVLGKWIDESYRAVAPKKLTAGLPVRKAVGGRPGQPPRRGRPRRRAEEGRR